MGVLCLWLVNVGSGRLGLMGLSPPKHRSTAPVPLLCPATATLHPMPLLCASPTMTLQEGGVSPHHCIPPPHPALCRLPHIQPPHIIFSPVTTTCEPMSFLRGSTLNPRDSWDFERLQTLNNITEIAEMSFVGRLFP